MAYDVKALVRDLKFQSLPFNERRAVLAEADPEFGEADNGTQNQVLAGMKNESWWGGNKSTSAWQASQKNVSFSKPQDTRKISYTDSGYRPNKKAETPKEFAKNLVQDVVEAPLFPVRALKDLVNSPDTVDTLKGMGKGLITTPAGFVPGLSDIATGKPASENWLTNPGVGAMTIAAPAAAAKKIATVRQAYKNTPKNVEPAINSAVEYGVSKGIRPPVSGKRTDPQVRAYNQNARTTVETIIENKDALELTTPTGEKLLGKLPETNSQFAQAIDQVKRLIFKDYDGMKQAAGEAGAMVPLNGVAAELAPIISNAALQDMKPGVVAYAKKMADTYTKRGAYTPEQAQNAIASYNASLEAFYKNPSYEAASKVAVDAAIVNTLRRSLDDTITNLEGPGYQQIKNKYGALKALEKDVNQRAVVSGRAAPNGFFDIANVATGAEAVSALLRLDPVGMAKAGTMQAIKARMKYLNKPDTAIKQMFEQVDKLKSKQTPMGPPAPEAIPLPNVSTYFDESIGARRPTDSPSLQRTPTNLPAGPARLSDLATGTRVPINNPQSPRTPLNLPTPAKSQNSRPRTPTNLPSGDSSYFDPTVGARVRKKP